MKQMRYTLKDLQTDFPDEQACLTWIVEWLNPNGIFCPRCNKIRKHSKISRSKAYACNHCGREYHPTANTIFHRTSTPLTSWFYAIYAMSATRCGISSKQLQRELGVSYKTAWRMSHQIRKMMAPDGTRLRGIVEVDEAYIHPNPTRRSTAKKHHSEVLFGMVERNGRAIVRHVRSSGVRVLVPEIQRHIALLSMVYSDEAAAYKKLPVWGYPHKAVNHRRHEYVREEIYTQNVENLWSHIKRGIRGVYRHVDATYLQAYANEFAFRYSHRNDYQPMFWALLGQLRVLQPAVVRP